MRETNCSYVLEIKLPIVNFTKETQLQPNLSLRRILIRRWDEMVQWLASVSREEFMANGVNGYDVIQRYYTKER